MNSIGDAIARLNDGDSHETQNSENLAQRQQRERGLGVRFWSAIHWGRLNKGQRASIFIRLRLLCCFQVQTSSSSSNNGDLVKQLEGVEKKVKRAQFSISNGLWPGSRCAQWYSIWVKWVFYYQAQLSTAYETEMVRAWVAVLCRLMAGDSTKRSGFMDNMATEGKQVGRRTHPLSHRPGVFLLLSLLCSLYLVSSPKCRES